MAITAAAVAAVFVAMTGSSFAGTYAVTRTDDANEPGTLRYAINLANANPGSAINFNLGTSSVVLQNELPQINANVTINGNGAQVSGFNNYRIFFVNSGTVAISDLTLRNGRATGGTGGLGGGGGGLGAGGAIFVRGNDGGRVAPTVTLSNLTLRDNQAIGGRGGAPSVNDPNQNGGGGGGGLAGNGGNAGTYGGGGGGAFLGSDGGSGTNGQPGSGGTRPQDGGAPGAGDNGNEFQGGGGGASSGTGRGGDGGFGAGAGGGGLAYKPFVNTYDANGNLTSSVVNYGGAAGLGGGGGGDNLADGGFGGGGGAVEPRSGVRSRTGSEFGGGSSFGTEGGGGAALGGAIFIAQGANVTLANGGVITGNETFGGLDGLGGSRNVVDVHSAGLALGEAIFLQRANVTFDVAAGQTRTLSQAIVGGGTGDSRQAIVGTSNDNAQIALGTAGLTKTGGGRFVATSNLRYGGETRVNGGTLEVTTGSELSSGLVTVTGAELLVSGTGLIYNRASAYDSAQRTSQSTITINGTATTGGVLNVTGSGKIDSLPFLVVGAANDGTANLGGGSITLKGGVTLGNAAGSRGTLNVTAGDLRANQMFVGFTAGQGAVNQSGGTIGILQLQLGQTSAGTVSISDDGYFQTNAALLGSQAAGSGTLNVSGGQFRTLGDFRIGVASRGAVVQSGGVIVGTGVTQLSNGDASQGSFSISGGQSLFVTMRAGEHAPASIMQTGGTFEVDKSISLGSSTYTGDGTLYVGINANSSYALSNGTLLTDTTWVGFGGGYNGTFTQTGGTINNVTSIVGGAGNGTFTQSAGAHNVSGTLQIAQRQSSTSVYNFSGGTLNAGSVQLGAVALLDENPNDVPPGDYRGILNQSGGAVTVAGNLDMAVLANFAAKYDLSGPTASSKLSSANLRVGVGGQGDFFQRGGTNAVSGDLSLGLTVGSTGNYALSGGVLTTDNTRLAVGSQGFADTGHSTSNFLQTGGAQAVAGALQVAVGSGSQAAYTLSGGTLTTARTEVGVAPDANGGVFVAGGTGTFTQTGGTHTTANLVIGDNGTYAVNAPAQGLPTRLIVGDISGQDGRGTLTLSGGVLRPSRDNADFIHGLASVSLGANTTVYDTNGFKTTINATLGHAAALSATRDGGLNVVGLGTLTINGNTTYNGDTRVQDRATLILNSALFGTPFENALNVTDGTLGGTGVVGPAVNVGTLDLGPSFGKDGHLNPGTPGTVGRLSVYGLVTFGQYGTFDVDVGATTFDSLLLINATIDGRAKIAFSSLADATFAIGQELVLIDNRGIPGFGSTFSNLADDSLVRVGNLTYLANYQGGDGNDLSLTVVVPEPATLTVIAALAGVSSVRRRRPSA